MWILYVCMTIYVFMYVYTTIACTQIAKPFLVNVIYTLSLD